MPPRSSLAVLLALPVLLLSTSARADVRYVYAGSERELPLDVTRIAVEQRATSSAEIAARLGISGVTAADVMPWPIANWWIVSVPTSARTLAGVEALVAELAGRGTIEFASPVCFGDDGGPLFATRRLLVGVEDPSSSAARDVESGRYGAVLERRFGGLESVVCVESAERNGSRVIEHALALARSSGIRFAEPDMIFTGRSGHVPNDAGFANCWGIDNTGQLGGTVDSDMDGPEAWDRTLGNSSVVVVVIDTGVQLDHPDIEQVAGIDTTSDGPSGAGGPRNAFDVHGTAVAGCVSATIDNGIGTVGIAPGCRTASARTFISVTTGSWTSQASWTVNTLAWAQSIGARVTNNSNGYGFQSNTIAAKYQDTWNAGIVHFASAGNDASTTLTYPASIPIVNAVMALERHGNRASFSNVGVGIDFAAPGQDVYTTDRTGTAGYTAGDYAYVYGTSFASPYTAGVAALVCSALPGASAATVEQIVRDSCVELGAPGYDTTFGFGFVNADRALAATCEAPLAFCSTSPNSVGPGARMSFAGTTSISANDLTLIASECPPNASGLFYFGSATTQIPFGNGFRCVTGTTFRLPIVVVNVFGEAVRALDVPSLLPSAGVVPGATKHFQLWYRNPAGGGAGFNLSDGLQVRFCP